MVHDHQLNIAIIMVIRWIFFYFQHCIQISCYCLSKLTEREQESAIIMLTRRLRCCQNNSLILSLHNQYHLEINPHVKKTSKKHCSKLTQNKLSKIISNDLTHFWYSIRYIRVILSIETNHNQKPKPIFFSFDGNLLTVIIIQ